MYNPRQRRSPRYHNPTHRASDAAHVPRADAEGRPPRCIALVDARFMGWLASADAPGARADAVPLNIDTLRALRRAMADAGLYNDLTRVYWYTDQASPLLIDDVVVRCFEQRHPGGSYAYSFEKNGRKVIYATDNELDLTLVDPAGVARDLRAPRELPAAFVEFCRGADLLIADGQYTDDEYPKYVGWGHARATTVVDLAVAAGVRQLAIYHHDPMQSDRDVEAKIELCRQRAGRFGSPLFVFAAREGIELRVD